MQKHFGNEAVSFLRSVRSRMLGLTPLLSHGPFIDKALQACDKLLDPENIETFMRLLYKGIVSGLDLRGEYPVKGDISMYGDEMSKYSIGSGFAGVSLALLKSSCLENSEWFYAIAREKYISVLRKLKDGMSFRAGLFNLFCHICRESTVPILRILSLSISFAFPTSVKKEFGNGLN